MNVHPAAASRPYRQRTRTWITVTALAATVLALSACEDDTVSPELADQPSSEELQANADCRWDPFEGWTCPLPTPAKGWVWANQVSARDYEPMASYQYNSSGATNTVTRSGTGVYTVHMPGLAGSTLASGAGGTVLVTGYGGNHRCKTTGWHFTGANLDVSVQCHAPVTGARTDGRFTALYYREAGFANRNAGYLWADSTLPASPSLAYRWNARLGGATVENLDIYERVEFSRFRPSGSNEVAFVTAYGQDPGWCTTIGGWSSYIVNCYNASGALLPGSWAPKFTTSVIPDARVGGGPAYHGAGVAVVEYTSHACPYTLPTERPVRQFNSTGLRNDACWDGAEQFTRVLLDGIPTRGRTTVQVTALYDPSTGVVTPPYCSVLGWGSHPEGSEVRVACFDGRTGTRLSGGEFTLLFLTDSPV